MRIKNKRGQSTIEYILLVTAVIAIMIIFSTSNSTGIRSALNGVWGTATSDMGTGMTALSASHAPGNAVAGPPENSVYVNVDGNLPGSGN